jgi:hypothetical protein
MTKFEVGSVFEFRMCGNQGVEGDFPHLQKHPKGATNAETADF